MVEVFNDRHELFLPSRDDGKTMGTTFVSDATAAAVE